MAKSASKYSAPAIQPDCGYCPAHDDPHDEWAMEALGIVLNASLLFQKLCGKPDVGAHEAIATAALPRSDKKPRRKAA